MTELILQRAPRLAAPHLRTAVLGAVVGLLALDSLIGAAAVAGFCTLANTWFTWRLQQRERHRRRRRVRRERKREDDEQ